jgi:hypothetical protein
MAPKTGSKKPVETWRPERAVALVFGFSLSCRCVPSKRIFCVREQRIEACWISLKTWFGWFFLHSYCWLLRLLSNDLNLSGTRFFGTVFTFIFQSFLYQGCSSAMNAIDMFCYGSAFAVDFIIFRSRFGPANDGPKMGLWKCFSVRPPVWNVGMQKRQRKESRDSNLSVQSFSSSVTD